MTKGSRLTSSFCVVSDESPPCYICGSVSTKLGKWKTILPRSACCFMFLTLLNHVILGSSWVGLAEAAAAMATTDHFKILISCAFVPGLIITWRCHCEPAVTPAVPMATAGSGCCGWWTRGWEDILERKFGGEKKGNTIELKSRFSGEDFFQCVSFFMFQRIKISHKGARETTKK